MKYIELIRPYQMLFPDGSEWNGSFSEYLQIMGCTLNDAIISIRKIGEIPDTITPYDAYFTLALMYATYGLVIQGDHSLAEKLAYIYLTDNIIL